jgi:uncharacterized linocin/CFP29 family protein
MNNLHRELAPISDAAWAQIDQEATRTLKRYLAARRVVDVPEPKGPRSRPWERATPSRSMRPAMASKPCGVRSTPWSNCACPSR